jgi:hypothetical protein
MHTKNLFVADDGSTLCVVDPKYRCIGSAYGFNEEPQYDEKGELLNRLTSNDEARANAKLWAAAADLAEALQGVLRVADRKTDEFDAARAALEKAGIA